MFKAKLSKWGVVPGAGWGLAVKGDDEMLLYHPKALRRQDTVITKRPHGRNGFIYLVDRKVSLSGGRTCINTGEILREHKRL